MTREEAKKRIKDNLESYLAARGINPQKPFCCLNPAHDDKNPSMRLDRKQQRVHCFACGVNYDTFDLIGLECGLTDNAAIFQKAYERFGIEGAVNTPGQEHSPLSISFTGNQLATKAVGTDGLCLGQEAPSCSIGDGLTGYFEKARQHIHQTSYPQDRGLGTATITHFGLGYDVHYRIASDAVWKALIIPTGDSSCVVRNTDPNADAKNRIRKRGGNPIFNATALRHATQSIFVVEGEIDALSIYEVGGAAVALGSTSNVQRFLQCIQTHPPQRPLLIALDNDPPGQKAADELTGGLSALGVPHYCVNIAGAHKDANEALLADRDAFAAHVRDAEAIDADARQAQQEKYRATSVAFHLPSFIAGIADRVNTPCIPTGFAKLDAHLDGGLFEGLYIVGAISSLGKTTLVLQIADQIALRGTDVLIFSLEMARTEMMAKSISRLTLLDALENDIDTKHAKTARGVTDGARYAHYGAEEKNLIDRALKNYGQFAKHVYIHEGMGEIGAEQIRRQIADHIQFTGQSPVVMVDYIQIIAPHNDRATDKQNTDKVVMELKRISRDFKLPVLGISSFNRASYKEAVTMEAFKESGAIEYSSDVLIGLQLKGAGGKNFDAAAEKDENPRAVELVILKNRNGPTGRKASFEYYPLFNFFRES